MVEKEPVPVHLPPPPPAVRRPAEPPRPKARRRPRFGVVIVAVIVTRMGRELVGRQALGRYGIAGIAVVLAALAAVMLLWRAGVRAQVRRRGGVEYTPEMVTAQIEDSGLEPAAFPEDGTLLGASVLVVNQHPKLLEVNTTYEIFGTGGRPLGAVRQIGQTRGKQLARIFTAWDQYFTHHFDLLDVEGRPVLRLTRPRKLFRTKVHVFDGHDRFLGTIQQLNVFWKIRFQLVDAYGMVVGHLRAANVRAWDFDIYNRIDRRVATVVKTWEGWSRTAFTRADRYVVRVHEPLEHPLRQLTLAAAVAADVALKQDARGFF